MADDPKRFATITIPDADKRIAAGENVRVEIGKGAAATSFAMIAVLSPKDLKARTTFRFPQMNAGSQHSWRWRSEKQGIRPGPYSAAVPIILQPLAAPSAVAATSRAGDASMADVTWVPGELKERTVIRVRVKGRQSWRTRYAVAGSTAAVLEALKPSTTYELEVFHKEMPPYSGVSGSVATTFTTGTDVHSLPVPTNPTGFVERSGAYGMEVTAAEVPSQISFEVAIETAPDAGTFGDFREATHGIRTAVQPPGRTRFTGLAPADGKARHLRARTIRHGATASDYCAVVEVLPYSAAPDGTPTTRESRRKHVTKTGH